MIVKGEFSNILFLCELVVASGQEERLIFTHFIPDYSHFLQNKLIKAHQNKLIKWQMNSYYYILHLPKNCEMDNRKNKSIRIRDAFVIKSFFLMSIIRLLIFLIHQNILQLTCILALHLHKMFSYQPHFQM